MGISAHWAQNFGAWMVVKGHHVKELNAPEENTG